MNANNYWRRQLQLERKPTHTFGKLGKSWTSRPNRIFEAVHAEPASTEKRKLYRDWRSGQYKNMDQLSLDEATKPVLADEGPGDLSKQLRRKVPSKLLNDIGAAAVLTAADAKTSLASSMFRNQR